MWDGQVKVITGIRRCGKSYLLRILFKNYLLHSGVPEDHILSYELDLAKDIRYRNPLELAKAVREQVEGQTDGETAYLALAAPFDDGGVGVADGVADLPGIHHVREGLQEFIVKGRSCSAKAGGTSFSVTPRVCRGRLSRQAITSAVAIMYL